MMSKMSGDRLAVLSDHDVPLEQLLQRGVRDGADVSALASLDGNKLCVLAWHYHDDDVAGDDAAVTLTLKGLPASASGDAKVEHYRIDQTHSNAFTAWKAMGSPQEPTAQQYEKLVASGLLAAPEASTTSIADRTATITLALPRQGVSLLVVTW
jgi:xylan 1,4-beta-xylosidase